MKESGEVFNPLGMTVSEIAAELGSRGICNNKMRAIQVYNWIYKQAVHDINIASNLGDDVKSIIKLSYPVIQKRLRSEDGTEKFLLKLSDNETIEIVLIYSNERCTLCVSSQIGCSMGCKFCNTATQGLTRNLTAEEILLQYLTVKNLGKIVTNIVFMGMGEPLDNFDNLEKALLILMDHTGISFPKNKITISTSGVIEGIKKIEKLKMPLAISLHSACPDKRSKLMPINYQYPLEELMLAISEYRDHTNIKKITLEYIMIDGFNDTKEDALKLIKLLKGKKYKINLIPFNDWGHKFFKPSSSQNILLFQSILIKAKLQCNIRKSAGQDIMAACGELKSAEKLAQ